MDFDRSLFASERICLAPINYETDPEIESRWTQDADYFRLVGMEPARPLSPFQVKARYEEIEKKIEEEKNRFYFTIRTTGEDRLIGYADIAWIMWANGYGFLRVAIGDPADRGRGFGREALHLVLGYAFEELALYRLSALYPAYNKRGGRFFEHAGFTEETRRRQAVYRCGRRWDMVKMGLLNEQWRSLR